ncbi:hypothetical protein [Actinoplanes sp. RD1]|uniref:hypothetical protein n=1 Tax=Actinoplanes sp. RD1 TaxID=3064538 RepID=UPI002741AC52|nr:hypothetical protein [Actinoplanes sp. RD1]
MAASGDAKSKRPFDGRASLLIGLLAAAGMTAIAIYAVAARDTAPVLATGLMLAGAATVVGGLLGFLFGVPRSTAGADGGGVATGRRYRANTNLEQISDWLTKILVGVGLVQIGELSRLGGSLVDSIAPALGGTAASVPFGAALLCYFAILGFLAGWLLTQLYLGRALSSADEALDLLQAADEAQFRGAETEAAELRKEAIHLLASTAESASSYESIRRRMPSGRERTDKLEQVMSTARRAAAAGGWSVENVRAAIDTGSEGDRVLALGAMQGDIARLADLDRVVGVIGGSGSPFEQFHGLLTGMMMVSTLDPGQRRSLAEAVEVQLGPNGYLKPGRERTLMARRILDVTRAGSTGDS